MRLFLSIVLLSGLLFGFSHDGFAQNCREVGGYPFVEDGCKHARDLNAALSQHPSPTVPQNAQGQGPLYGFVWLDTSTTPNSVRQCKATSCSITYNSSQWTLLGTIDVLAGWIPNVSNQGLEATLASASTVNLGSVPNNNITITGTTGINSFGSSADVGSIRILTFNGVMTLVNSANLILPGGVNIVTTAGDTAGVKHLGSGVWKVLWFTRFSNSARLADLETLSVVTGTGAQAISTIVTIWKPGTPAATTFTLPATGSLFNSDRRTIDNQELTGAFLPVIAPNSGQTIRLPGGSSNFILNNPGASITFRFVSATLEWIPE
jgi:hypothetical protein